MFITMYSLNKCTVVRHSNLHAKLTDNNALLTTILVQNSDLADSEFYFFFFSEIPKQYSKLMLHQH